MDYNTSVALFRKLVLEENEDYRIAHQAPDKSSAPLYDLTMNGVYPEDVYSDKGKQYYGDSSPFDNLNFFIIRQFHTKPKQSLKIYRAVPKEITDEEKIYGFQQDKKYILKTGKLPKHVKEEFPTMNSSEYYDYADSMIQRIERNPTHIVPEKIKINPGDWVTINKAYAVEHGKAQFAKGYRILSKAVKANQIFTNGDSLSEWGYDPS
jgi:hypothetical protein